MDKPNGHSHLRSPATTRRWSSHVGGSTRTRHLFDDRHFIFYSFVQAAEGGTVHDRSRCADWQQGRVMVERTSSSPSFDPFDPAVQQRPFEAYGGLRDRGGVTLVDPTASPLTFVVSHYESARAVL